MSQLSCTIHLILCFHIRTRHTNISLVQIVVIIMGYLIVLSYAQQVRQVSSELPANTETCRTVGEAHPFILCKSLPPNKWIDAFAGERVLFHAFVVVEGCSQRGVTIKGFFHRDSARRLCIAIKVICYVNRLRLHPYHNPDSPICSWFTPYHIRMR